MLKAYVTDFENIVGQGIKGKINESYVYAGNVKLIESINKKLTTIKKK